VVLDILKYVPADGAVGMTILLITYDPMEVEVKVKPLVPLSVEANAAPAIVFDIMTLFDPSIAPLNANAPYPGYIFLNVNPVGMLPSAILLLFPASFF